MIRLNDILDNVSAYNPTADMNLIRKAYVYCAKVHQGQTRLSGEPYIIHPMEVAGLLAELRLDVPSIVTGFLHDTIEDTLATPEELARDVRRRSGRPGGRRHQDQQDRLQDQGGGQAENFRKMLLAMASDIRVILVKLADRLHNMRTLQFQPDREAARIARETHRYLRADRQPPRYFLGQGGAGGPFLPLPGPARSTSIWPRKIAKKKQEREAFVAEAKAIIAEQAGSSTASRAMFPGAASTSTPSTARWRSRNVEFDEIYDLIAIRISVDDIRECYEVLGVIHSAWKPIPGRFKDYIAMPKGNMYQSLHTTVIGPHGDRMEVQIRTHEMHRVADAGIAAHWKYKEGKGYDEKEVKRFAWLRQLLEWQQELQDSKEFMDSVKVELFPEEVYVFTPKGDVKGFPKGSTPIDFAYSVHTDIGHRCVGAKVNGKLVPLKYELKNGDIVEVITSPHHTPSKDWLKIVKSSRARNKIRAWIKTEERKRSIVLGREICEKDFRRYSLNLRSCRKAAT